MSKTRSKTIPVDHDDIVNRELQKLNLRDLKIACVLRGCDPEKVINSTVLDLSHWFHKHFYEGQDPSRIAYYDSYVKDILIKRGHKEGDPLMAPILSLGYTGSYKDTGETKPKEKVISKEPKEKRERDENLGVYSGTKKHLTITCAKEGMNFEDTLEKVKATFGEDVSPKSVKIWFKKANK